MVMKKLFFILALVSNIAHATYEVIGRGQLAVNNSSVPINVRQYKNIFVGIKYGWIRCIRHCVQPPESTGVVVSYFNAGGTWYPQKGVSAKAGEFITFQPKGDLIKITAEHGNDWGACGVSCQGSVSYEVMGERK